MNMFHALHLFQYRVHVRRMKGFPHSPNWTGTAHLRL